MSFTREQKKEAYRKLSPEVQNFVMDSENTEIIDAYLKESGLSEDQNILADIEIQYAMYNLQTLSETINNIAKLSNKNIEDLSKLKENLEKNIFIELDKIKNKAQENKTSDQIQTKEMQPQNNIGTSFEQIILNQAKAMQPARPAGWVPPDRIMNQKEEKPTNLPTGDSEPKVIHNYINEPDPYREPIE